MTVAAINGSPRREKSVSAELIHQMQLLLPEIRGWTLTSSMPWARRGPPPVTELASLYRADALLIAFPLYVDGLPASLVEYLEAYAAGYPAWQREEGAGRPPQRVFAIANCGFYEGVQNAVALRVCQLFCQASGLDWAGGLGIGTGGMAVGLRNVPPQAGIRRPVTSAQRRLAEAMREPGGRLPDDIFTQHSFPWWLYKLAGEASWRHSIKRNGLGARQLNARPYQN
ncbi:MAG: hypothetical protein A2087_02820 [Spirochaetes bacterium GWD1_61_31]|nr:MAG: hypothetical protein A2Y37_09665 [Spirochaetes bacterium GWB1_60_80]OHD31675.1 MAG: hypothetical protein A2004_03205 [Spirochaetes bacterium GWC1_61_12]OHD41472.1 MAG: hypothetical protein A2Y35_05970 [Spirochaetes bacterium GWE1_60_18]OHD41522.1 MAG: hypothetical protein A2087_02820 [Spirochaetes bacterium GWD1_61_31]OHD61374.1 MAG: hypothetical protein A2Y32_04360 [Spirochaetes bacterium GWF1_60_12]HAP42478.1 hypothetical protein [Spirochaetaceae bacterium]